MAPAPLPPALRPAYAPIAGLLSLVALTLAACGSAPSDPPQAASVLPAYCEVESAREIQTLSPAVRLGWIDRVIADCPKDSDEKAEDYLLRGGLRAEMPGEGPRLAVQDFSQAIALRPDYAAAYRARSAAYVQLGRYMEALADSGAAIALAPSAADYVARATIHKALGDDAAALADYGEAIALDPEAANSYSSRGLLYAKLGQTDEAVADFATAIELDPLRARQWQEILGELGYYDGPQDGVFDEASLAALRAWIDAGTPGLQHSTAVTQ